MKSTYNLPLPGADGPLNAGTEPLIGAGSWPGAGSSFLLSGDEKQRALAVTVSSQSDYGLPGPADRPADAALRAAEQGERYRLICSQLQEPGLTVSLLSTLHPGLVLPVADGASSLWRHAAAAELFALAAATATPPKLTGIETLGELLDRYGLLPRAVAAANADQPLSSLLDAGQTLTVSAADSEAGADSEPGADREPRAGSKPVEVGSDTLAAVADRLASTPERLLQDNRDLRLAAEPSFVLPGIAGLPPEARTPYSVQAGDTLAVLSRSFDTTPRALVAANANRAGALPAGIRVEVTVEPVTPDTDAPAEADEVKPGAADDVKPAEGDDVKPAAEASTVSTDTVAGDSFQTVCDRLVKQNAGVTLDAVADALALLDAELVAGTVLSCPLAVLGDSAHPDGAHPDRTAQDGRTELTAAEVQAQYGCPPTAFAAANAALLGILQPGVELGLSGGATTVTARCDTLNAVLGRLASAQTTPTIAQLMSDNASAPLFRAGAQALLPPPPVTLTVTCDQVVELAAPAVRLAVTLRLERAGPKPKPADATNSTAADRADSAVPPPSRDDDSWQRPDATPFTAFVDACLAALPTVRLATDPNEQLWMVSFDSDGICRVRVEPSAGGALGPQLFALRAPYQQLADFDAWISPVTEQGSLGTPTRQRYQGLDVEPWARLFLSDLERYLSEPFSAQLPSTARARLSDLRRGLAAAIAGGLTGLLRDEPEGPGLSSARAALTGIARASLTSAYASVLAQYRTVVISPYGRDGFPAARLHGTMTAAGRADLDLSESRIGLEESDSWCAYALTSNDPRAATTVSPHPDQVVHALELGSPGLDTLSAEPMLLRFVRPLAGGYRPEAISVDLPPADLPMPLREQPNPAGNLTSTATPTFAGPGQPTLAQAAQWTTGFSYTHEHAAQDVVRVSTQGLLPPGSLTEAAQSSTAGGGPAAGHPARNYPAGGTALAEALAAYTETAGDLTRLIGSGVPPVDSSIQPAGSDPAIVGANAADSLVELAEAIATAWAGHWVGQPRSDAPSAEAQPADAGPAQAQQRGCRLRAVYATDSDGRRLLERLAVGLDGDEDRWPVITLVSGDEQLPLAPGPVTAGARDYTAAEPPEAPRPLTLRLDWPGLRGAPRPDARISATVERNPVLHAGKPTSPALVLTTPVSQLAVARPSVRWSEQLPLTGDTLAAALQNAFDDLFGEQPVGCRLSVEVDYAAPVAAPPSPDAAPVGCRLSVEVDYAAPVAAPPSPDAVPVAAPPSADVVSDLWMVLPVLLVPELLLAPDTAAALAAELQAWRQASQPSADGAQWRLRLALLSTPDEPPLLAFDQLVFPVSPGSPPR